MAALALTLAACSSDDFEPKVSSIQVTSAQTSLEAVGGSCQINTTQPIASAYAQDGWLTVSTSGNVATVSAAANEALESRNTVVVLKAANNDSTVINVSQMGAVLIFDNPELIGTDNAGATYAYPVRHNLPVSVDTGADWVTSQVTEDSVYITVQPNSTSHVRSTTVLVSCGERTDEVDVIQAEMEDNLLGNWALVAYELNRDGELEQSMYPVTLAQAGETTMTMRLTSFNFTLGLEFMPNYGAVTLPNAQYVGRYASYYVFNLESYDYQGTEITVDASRYLLGFLQYDPDLADGVFEGTYADLMGEDTDLMIFFAFNNRKMSSEAMVGNLLSLYYPTLVKLDDASAARGSHQNQALLRKMAERQARTHSFANGFQMFRRK